MFNCQTGLQSPLLYHTLQTMKENSGAPHPCQHLVVVIFLTLVVLMGVKWYLTVNNQHFSND